MAVKIRLKRMGAKKRPFYRVVVADARSPRDGRFIESLGFYDPLKSPKVFQVDDERIRHWMATGARPSDAVRELLERQGTLPQSARPARTKTGPKHPARAGQGAAPAAAASPTAPTEAVPEEAADAVLPEPVGESAPEAGAATPADAPEPAAEPAAAEAPDAEVATAEPDEAEAGQTADGPEPEPEEPGSPEPENPEDAAPAEG
ncbi:MAG: 30S ribosomal protein S16 [Candidatus Dormibacteria bacterium]